MKPVRIQVPSSLTPERVIALFQHLEGEERVAGQYIFDFSRLSWTPPFGMLFFSEQLRQFRHARPDAAFAAVGHNGNTYQAHMGFFRSFGLDYGNEPGAASGSSSYLPIRLLEFDRLLEEAGNQGVVPQELIECEATKMSQVLARESEGTLVDTLSYSLREILRNALEHSSAERVTYCAQFWPTRRFVELAIVDGGRGVRESLLRNPSLKVQDDREALTCALLPGISGRGMRRRSAADVWANSGFGLYMTSHLCGNGGHFLIVSGSAGIRLQAGQRTWLTSNFQGTAICAALRTDQLMPLRDSLAHLRREGEATAREIDAEANVSASLASRMLARHFKSGE